MLKNYIKIAFRNLFKHKVFSLINIVGLAVGIACCILIALYIHHEWSFDQFHAESDRIYRTWVKEDYGDGEVYFNTVTPLVLKPKLEQNIPGIEVAARRYLFNEQVKRSDAEQAFSQSIHMVDPGFFEIFDFDFLSGSSGQLFSTPNHVALTPDAAKRYFGDEDPLQKTILIKMGQQFEPFTVAGLLEKPAANSSIRYEMVIPFSNSRKLFSPRAFTSWFNVAAETYVMLRGVANPGAVSAKFPGMMRQALGEEEYANSNYSVGLQPLTDIHLNTEFPTGIAPVSDPTYSYILGAIALLVLIIACVNFMTLSVSRSARRALEVGVRKTMGAQSQHIMYQFWGEALLMTLMALIAGVIMAELMLPMFNSLSGTELSLSFGMQSVHLFIGLAVTISLAAGMYPALLLSGFRPVEVLKGKLGMKADKSLFRKGMVVFQFTLSIFLISSTLIVTRQLDFLSKDLGYQKEQIVIVQTDATLSPQTGFQALTDRMHRKKELLQNELSSQSGVVEVSSSMFTPAQPGWIAVDYRDNSGRKREMNINFVDENYLQAMDITITRGRSFSEENPSDRRQALIVNEALVAEFGWENPIGQRLPGQFENHEIIGVTENFNYESLYSEVEPLALAVNPEILLSGIDNIGFQAPPSPRITLKIASDEVPATMAAIQSAWEKVAPSASFNFTFLDQAVDSRYRQEERLGKIVTAGSTLAIVIACLGLFGLAALMVVRRTKEIGVRKVLGASASSIVYMVNREFTKLVATAFIIAVPFSWYAVNQWLQDFAYRVELGIGVFLLAGTIALVVAWLTVSYQSIKAALIDPVKSLRSE
ncbi:ABC transporter permease [Aliifodinibius sp. S!AR15-10]|uniref:ABC transporter permease n=1 Tax=Aliifodinibius sp. S!AR15-10 TaxID=2950437 RepID=UPI002858DEA4|nr:ABC transporter permease [Aliifodinibius sp. S!AR15-10]MDR8393443.1 ABC transporter permease [Aliifodinibius sp. S!AR15-10]